MIGVDHINKHLPHDVIDNIVVDEVDQTFDDTSRQVDFRESKRGLRLDLTLVV